LLLQAVAIASSRNSVQAYNLGTYTFLSSAVLAGILLIQGTKVADSLLHSCPEAFALRVTEFLLSLCLAISALCIPRRPDVFYNGELVDRMYTASALSRFTFGWPVDILKLATRKKDLDLVDLTRPDHFTRAASVSASWKKRENRHSLWLGLILAHKDAFVLQWFLTLCTSVLNFAPQWVILQLLQFLERRQPGVNHGLEAWMWVVWLGVAIIGGSWVESYVFWLSYSDLNIPVRAQLSALIFEKAMRRKDAKGTGKANKKARADHAESAESASGAASSGQSESEIDADDSEELKKSKQSTVNLVGVDGKRVSDFAAFQYLFPGSLFKLIVSLVFLVSLLGWKPLLAGFSAMLAIIPFNAYFSKKYAASQDRLMKVRDEKMEVVTEALQGIRQIKFSALEPDWEKKIGGVRERELGAIWSVFINDTALLACWVTSPILLSAISLAVYAVVNGSLSPSVAFVSLGIFKGLEMTLSVIPELTTDALDAWVSVKRIEEYLNSPEVSRIAEDSDEVSFDNASIAWPSDENLDEQERFVLRNINVTFPKGELSVISGKTGTGKSLMLAAILGEVDVLGGTLYVPRPPPLSERHDDKANRSNWIIPSAIAYVAQIPWIENASIRDNILFGLPFDEERYNKTVEVCALKKDLEMLSDGEDTEIGANGINLSGGQKWRVTLARAIYSRAGILVLDDIFSAVDAHVGRHIFEKCLNGELATGRTRILVTHHVALCEPKTKYLVELGNGGVLHAGLLSELQEGGILQKIKSHEQTPEEIEADESATAVNSESASAAERDGISEVAPKKVTPKPTARKFVEEEAREQGAVRKHIYVTYLKDSGGWLYWAFAVILFAVVQGLSLGKPRTLTREASDYTDGMQDDHGGSRSGRGATRSSASMLIRPPIAQLNSGTTMPTVSVRPQSMP
jgi:ABC-type multidrug transport system fused ATPase/permease subunit